MDLEQLVASMPFAVHTGIQLDSAAPEQVVGHLDWDSHRTTAGNGMHGGALMTLADSVGARLCIPQSAARRKYVHHQFVDRLHSRRAQGHGHRNRPATACGAQHRRGGDRDPRRRGPPRRSGHRITGSTGTVKLPAYRASGATLPSGNLLASHDVAMGGLLLAIHDARQRTGGDRARRNQQGRRRQAGRRSVSRHTQADSSAPAEHPNGSADPRILGAYADNAFRGNADRTARVDFGDSHLDVRISSQRFWPHRRFGGSSYFQSVPALNQYWHPWLLGGRVEGSAVIDGQSWDLTGAQVYGEKNWGKGRIPGILVVGDRHRGSPILEPAWRLPADRSAPDLCAPKSPPSLPRYRTERYCGWVIR